MQNKHLEYSKAMIDLAFAELKTYRKTKSDAHLMEASEKGWNALAQLGAFYKNKSITHHKDTVMSIKNIPREDEKEMRTLAALGESLHANYYNNFFFYESIKESLETIRTLVNKKLKEEGYSSR